MQAMCGYPPKASIPHAWQGVYCVPRCIPTPETGREPVAGSGTRQRTKQCLVRFTDEEFSAASAKADTSGMTLAAFVRTATLGSPGLRAKHRPHPDTKLLLQVLGQQSRIGGNVNQIAKKLNSYQIAQIPEIRQAIQAYLDIRNAIYNALGMTPDEAPDDNQGKQPGKS